MAATAPLRMNAKEVAIRTQLVLFLGFTELAAVIALTNNASISFHYVAIAAACVLFLIMLLLGERAIIRDIQDICLFDVFVQIIGLISYEYRISVVYFLTLAQAVWLLKLLRLLWGINQVEPQFHAAWPVFGLLGLVRRKKQAAFEKYTYAEEIKIYGAILCTVPVGYAVLQLLYVVQIPLPSILLVLIVAGVLIRSFRQLDQAEAEELASLKAQAALAAQLAAQKRQLTEQNAELAAFSEERAQHARAVAERNAHLRHASHDLANRMMSAQATMRRAQALAADDEQRACLLELQAQQAQFLDALNGIIAQARVDAPLALPEIQAVACSAIKHNIWEATSELAAQHGTVLHVSVPDWPILTDPMQLERIVYNLLGNAIRHNPPGTHVGLTMRRHPQGCQIRVWDNGSGIAGMHGRNWGDNFTRFAFLCMAKAHRSDDAASHGVGIQSVAQLCAGLDISMTMYSRIGRGTVFRFWVPLSQ